MTPPYKKASTVERGIALVLFTLTLPILLGLTILGVDLGNLYITRDKLNSLNRSAAATAVNMRAFQGWAPLACSGEDGSPNKLGYKCASAISQTAPQGDKYGQLVDEINKTLISEITRIVPDAKSILADGSTTTSALVGYSYPGAAWTYSKLPNTAPIYNLRTDTYQLKVRYAAKTLFLTQLAKLFNTSIESLCATKTVAGEISNDKRCWVESTDATSNSSTTKARVIMLLDTSGSMQSKQIALKTAAGAFIDYFNPFKDEIGIVPYGTGVKSGATQPSVFNQAASDGALLKIKESVANLVMGGQTNPCDALIEANAMIPANTPSARTTRTFVVLFTDGAPNVYRLRFCDPASSLTGCTQPGELTKVSSSNDWYGWTVKWGRRATFNPTLNNPVFDPPQIKDNTGATTFDTAPFGAPLNRPNKFRINEDGTFMIRNSLADQWYPMENAQPPAPVVGMPYSKSFTPLTSAEDNYLWNGPSYLVNRKDQTSMASVSNLIDRVNSTFTTCGLPKPKVAGVSATNPDQFSYNHSLYFASRVLDTQWSLDRALFTGKQADAVYLRGATVRAAPLNFRFPPTDFTVKFYRGEGVDNASAAPVFNPPTTAPASPPAGCLDALDAELPITNTAAKLFVGAGRSSFWSNTNVASIGTVGEIIKTAELPYYCAIRAADYLRTMKNTTVFTVGLGQAAEIKYGATCEDPTQNALDFDSRKDFFLQRLAMAPEAIQFESGNTSSTIGATWRPSANFDLYQRTLTNCTATAHPLANQTVNLGFSQGCATSGTPSAPLAMPAIGQCQNPDRAGAKVQQFSPEAIGGYYPTSDPDKLKAQFGAIAKQILFRLSL